MEAMQSPTIGVKTTLDNHRSRSFELPGGNPLPKDYTPHFGNYAPAPHLDAPKARTFRSSQPYTVRYTMIVRYRTEGIHTSHLIHTTRRAPLCRIPKTEL